MKITKKPLKSEMKYLVEVKNNRTAYTKRTLDTQEYNYGCSF